MFLWIINLNRINILNLYIFFIIRKNKIIFLLFCVHNIIIYEYMHLATPLFTIGTWSRDGYLFNCFYLKYKHFNTFLLGLYRFIYLFKIILLCYVDLSFRLVSGNLFGSDDNTIFLHHETHELQVYFLFYPKIYSTLYYIKIDK